MIEHSDEIKDLAAALLAFQQQTHGVVKDSKNPHFKNRYASLEAVVEVAKGLNDFGVVFTQSGGLISASGMEMSTMLIHAQTGQWIKSTMQLPLGKMDPQGAGSAQTYGCRYSLMAALGLPPLDDDAEAATVRTPAPQKSVITSGPAQLAEAAYADEDESSRMYVKMAHIFMKKALDKTELREWWESEKDRRAEILSKRARDALLKEVMALAEKLPEVTNLLETA